MGFWSSALLGLVSLIDSLRVQVICIVGSGVSLIDSLWGSGHLHCWVWCLSHRFSMGFWSSALLGLVSLIDSLRVQVICIVGSGVSLIDSLWGSGHLHCWVWCLSS